LPCSASLGDSLRRNVLNLRGSVGLWTLLDSQPAADATPRPVLCAGLGPAHFGMGLHGDDPSSAARTRVVSRLGVLKHLQHDGPKSATKGCSVDLLDGSRGRLRHRAGAVRPCVQRLNESTLSLGVEEGGRFAMARRDQEVHPPKAEASDRQMVGIESVEIPAPRTFGKLPLLVIAMVAASLVISAAVISAVRWRRNHHSKR